MPSRAKALVVAVGFMIGTGTATGHPGGLNVQGCHDNRETGDYHCHQAAAEPVSPRRVAPGERISSDGVVKKSRDGICHNPGSTCYSRTTNFSPFESIDACLASGGLVPPEDGNSWCSAPPAGAQFT